MEPSFERLLVRLAEAGIQFIIVGGIAVTLHGYVRLTEDVDLLLDSSSGNIQALLGCLATYGEGHARELSPGDFTDEEGAIRIIEETEQCQIDLFTVMGGRKFGDVIVDACTFQLAGHAIPYASRDSLIGWKSRSVRDKDRLDAQALRQLEDDPKAFD